MYISNKEEFQPDKLKATFERMYVNIVVSAVAFIQHIARLRSWSEPKRTGGFMAVYAVAWGLDLLVPAFLVMLMVLILSPRARLLLFPSAPIAAIDPKTGQAKVPKAGHLGSKHSLTGAAETFEGEAVEQEASNFVGALGSVALSTAAGKSANKGAEATTEDTDDDEIDSDDSEGALLKRKTSTSKKSKKDPEDKIPDPTNIAAVSHSAQAQAAGEKTGHPDKGDHTKKPMEEAIFASLAPFMHILNNICDDYERFCNALSPTPPFSRWVPRYRLVGALLPVFLGSFFITETMIYKGSTFGAGFALFGKPLIDRVQFPHIVAWLDRNVPEWKKYLELRYMLLRGVPTNAQLTVTLLRIGEANKAPLPPPPPTVVAPPPSALHGSDMADHPDLPPEYAEQLADAQAEDVASRPPGEDESTTDPKTGKKGSKVLSIIKGVTKAVWRLHLASTGSKLLRSNRCMPNPNLAWYSPTKLPNDTPLMDLSSFKPVTKANVDTATSSPLPPHPVWLLKEKEKLARSRLPLLRARAAQARELQSKQLGWFSRREQVSRSLLTIFRRFTRLVDWAGRENWWSVGHWW